MNTQERFPLFLSDNREGALIMPRPLTIEDLAIIQRQIDAALNIVRAVFVEGEPHPAPPAEQEAQR